MGILALIATLSGCASGGAPAPVEQRQPTRDARILPTPAPLSSQQSSEPARGSERVSDQVQVTGLGDAATTAAVPSIDAAPVAPGVGADQPLSALGGTPAVGSATPSATPGTMPRPAADGGPEPGFAVANPAVVALLNRANRDAAAGRQGASAASLERAIKIEPGNAWLWYRLAQTRLRQNEPEAAASLAARSNSLAGDDTALRARNWRLIASVHQLRGESAAAREAQGKAERLEQGST